MYCGSITHEARPDYLLGSGKRLQDAVRIPIDRTVHLLAQHLVSKTVPRNPIPTGRDPPQARSQTMVQQPACDPYKQENDYNSYAASANSAGSRDHTGSSYLPPNPDVQAQSSSTYPDPHYIYHNPYTTGDSPYVAPSLPSSDALPATAAAANAYLNDYQQQPATFTPAYPPNVTKPQFNQYHSSGSPTSWRNWAGNMASTLEPGAEDMNSASALMQLGGRNEASVSQEFTVDNGPGQGWPLMCFNNGPGGG